jgi:hypothetical protein
MVVCKEGSSFQTGCKFGVPVQPFGAVVSGLAKTEARKKVKTLRLGIFTGNGGTTDTAISNYKIEIFESKFTIPQT